MMRKKDKQLIRELQECCRRIESLKERPAFSPEFTAWRRETESLLEDLLGPEATVLEDFRAIYYTPVFLTCRMGDEAFTDAYREGLEQAGKLIDALMGTIGRESGG